MRKLVLFIILLLAAGMVAPGCMAESLNVIGGIEPVQDIEMVDIEEPVSDELISADVNTTNISVNLDDTIVISLRENPTTGFLWEVLSTTGLEIISDEYKMDNAGKGMVGVGGVHKWTVKAIKTGSQTFSADLKRAFDKKSGNEKMYTLTVAVGMENMTQTPEPEEETLLNNPFGKNTVI